MKPKALINFVKKNALEIKKQHNIIHYGDKIETMMSSRLTCVLRPWSLPESIIDKMTQEEYEEYDSKASGFVDSSDIPVAIKWIKDWVSK